MKLTSFFLFIACLSVSAKGYTQITLSETNTSLQNVFKEIKKQSGYDFIFTYEMLEDAGKVTVKVKDVSLIEALEVCLKNKGLTYVIVEKTVVIKKKEEAASVQSESLSTFFSPLPPVDLKGRITNEKGEPVIATVTVKGTKNTTSSNENGEFTLLGVAENATIVITAVTIEKRELKLDGKTNITVNVKTKTITSDPVVVTAYGIERNKKELGYSVAKVSGEELNKANSGTVLNGLVGKVSGLNIGAVSSSMSPQMRVLIRGIRSFGESSNNQPLFIFNGAPLSFGSDGNSGQNAVDFINNLNPADIGEVTVLKGANATAMYGPEGVNGVIIITTKKTKVGTTQVNAQVNQSYQQIDWRHRGEQRVYGVGDGVDFFGGKATSSWGPAYDGRMIALGYPDAGGKYQMVPYTSNYDNHKFFNTAKTTRYNVSLAQADLNSSFYLGLGHVDQTGLLPGDNQSQTTVFYNAKKKLGKILDLQFNINYSQTKSDKGNDVTSDVLSTPSFIPLLSYKDYQNSYWGGFDTYWSGLNPYAKLAIARTTNTDNTLTGSIVGNLKIFSWLSVKDQFGLNYLGRTQKINVMPVAFSSFARVDPLKHSDGLPQTTDYLAGVTGINNDLLISAVKEKRNFVYRANFGSSVRQYDEKQLKTHASLVIPVYNYVYYRTDYGIGADEVTRKTRGISAFGNLSVGYKNRIFLEVTGRNDWDSKRAAVARGKDLYFGANSSLLLKEIIPLLKEQKWLSTLRLRLSAASTANLNIEPNQSEKILSLIFPYPYTSATGTSVLGYGLFTNPNPLIKPEKIFSQEYGLEMGFLDNRVRFDATYYHQINNGVIMKVAVPLLSGYPDYDNAGKLRNSGWEFDINLSPLVNFSKEFNISLDGRLSINNNRVLQVADIYHGSFTARDPNGQVFYANVGGPAFQFGVLDFMRDPQGRVIVDGTSGMPTPDYQHPKVVGNTLPVYQGGITLNLNYKRFTFSTQADYSGGNSHLFPTSTISNGTSSFTLLNNRKVFVFPNSVIQDQPGHYIENKNVAVSNAGQNLFQTFANATINGLTSGNYWKIRQVALDYGMPVSSKWIKKVTASIYARDLFSFYPKSNIFGDPFGSNGPGIRTNAIQAVGGPAPTQTNNLTGNSSDQNTLPGTVFYGFSLNFSF